MNDHLRIKDLVLIAAFSLLGIVIMYAIPIPFLFTPYTILISPILQSLFLALPFFLVGTKIQKRWAMFIYCVVWGLGGIMPYYIVTMIGAGILVEMILRKSHNLFRGLSLSFAITMICHYIGGTIIPYLLTKEQQMAMMRKMYGEDYAAKITDLRTIPFMIVVALLVVILSFVGSFLAKQFLKKHF